MHPRLKTTVEAALRYGGPALVARRLARGRALILAYHNVVPHDAPAGGDRSLHLPRSRFAEQLDLLARLCRVVPLDVLLEPPDPADPRPRAAVTFDDAYRGTVTVGVEELARRDLPGTIFVAPGLLDGRAVWWDVLAAPGGGGLAPAVRERGLGEFRGEDEAIRRWASGAGIAAAPKGPLPVVASEHELRAAADYPLLTLASHSWSHANLSRLDEAALRAELSGPLPWLRERYPRVIPWLAYPYGLASPVVRKEAAEWYGAAVLSTGGWLPRQPLDWFALPRLNVPAGLSASGFVLRISALVGR
jgi:peptidoglycan/xylan/chitin deacetylase (PgdA/CDA1 family)